MTANFLLRLLFIGVAVAAAAVAAAVDLRVPVLQRDPYHYLNSDRRRVVVKVKEG